MKASCFYRMPFVFGALTNNENMDKIPLTKSAAQRIVEES
jgi:hypothetical protein